VASAEIAAAFEAIMADSTPLSFERLTRQDRFWLYKIDTFDLTSRGDWDSFRA
jgi:hypothetical protein